MESSIECCRVEGGNGGARRGTPGARRWVVQNGISPIGIAAWAGRTRRLSAGRPLALALAVEEGHTPLYGVRWISVL